MAKENKTLSHYPEHKALDTDEDARVRDALRFARTDEEREQLEREVKLRKMEQTIAGAQNAVNTTATETKDSPC